MGLPAAVHKIGGSAVENSVPNPFPPPPPPKKKSLDESVPKYWVIGVIDPIYKKRDKTQCSNCRGISLLCKAYKIFTTVLLTRLKTNSASIIGEYQAGFRKGRSTTEQLESFEMWCWRGMEFSWTNHVRNEILHRVREGGISHI